MGRKNRNKPKNHNIKLEVGEFYNVHDGSVAGHPGRIESADEKNDVFISTTTGSKSKEEYEKNPIRKNHEELTQPTDKKVFKSYVHKKPFKGARDDYGDKHYSDMKYHPNDLERIKRVLKRKPRLGYWFKRKNKKPS